MKLSISQTLTLQPLNLRHAQPLLAAVNASREDLGKFLPWVNTVKAPYQAQAYILARTHSNTAGALWFAIYDGQTFCGVFGIKGIHPVKKVAEIGYWLTIEARGKGIVRQILKEAIAYLTQQTTARIVELRCHDENKASIAVARHAGARFTGYDESPTKLGKYQISLVDAVD